MPTDSVVSYLPLPTLSFGVFSFHHGTRAGPPSEFLGRGGGLNHLLHWYLHLLEASLTG